MDNKREPKMSIAELLNDKSPFPLRDDNDRDLTTVYPTNRVSLEQGIREATIAYCLGTMNAEAYESYMKLIDNHLRELTREELK